MWQASDRLFQCLIKSHHQVRVKAEILVDGIVVLTITGKATINPVTGQKASMIDGGVGVQRTQVRREMDATFLDLSDIPGDLTVTDARDLFAPLRTEVRLWRGFEYHDVTPYERMTGTGIEYWPIGTFILSKALMKWPTIALHGFDRLWNLRGRFQKPWVIASGTPNMEALEKLIRAFVPPLQCDLELPNSDALTGGIIWDPQDDILTRANDIVVATGKVLFADPMGTIRVVDEPTIDDSSVPVWTFQPGKASISQVPTREVDATDAQNVVVASGESDGETPPVTGIARDLNPASFTYVGKTPEVTMFYASPLLKTVAQCNLAARTILNRDLGVADTIVVPTIPLPGLEGGDLIKVVEPKIQSSDLLIADAFTIPLRASGAMSIECRTQRIT
jgi:hypothetical protein